MKLLIEKNELIFKPESLHDHFILGGVAHSALPTLVEIISDTDNPDKKIVAVKIKKEDLLDFLIK